MKLRLALEDNLETIPEYEFRDKYELVSFLEDKISNMEMFVYVFGSMDDDEFEFLFIEDSKLQLLGLVSFIAAKDSSLFVHAYSSYEEAYKVSLDMREPNPLCYDWYKNDRMYRRGYGEIRLC